MEELTQEFITSMQSDRESSLEPPNRQNDSAMFTYDSFQDAYKYLQGDAEEFDDGQHGDKEDENDWMY